MRRILKNTLVFILIFSLLSSFSFCFASSGKKEYYDYKNYVLLGDSVASGHKDDYFVESEFVRVDDSYAAYVADELGAQLYPYACKGFRTMEMRFLLEDNFTDIDKYLFHDTDTKTLDELKAMVPQMKKDIAKADLITLGIGGNDFGTVLSWVVMEEMEKTGVFDPFVKAARKYLEENGIDNDTIYKLVDLADFMDALPGMVDALPKALSKGVKELYNNWGPMIEDIRSLNSTADFIVLGMYDNSYKGEDAEPGTDSKQVQDIKKSITDAILSLANKPMIENAEKYNYTYVDTSGTACVISHPTTAGHKNIASKILNALPDKNFPY